MAVQIGEGLLRYDSKMNTQLKHGCHKCGCSITYLENAQGNVVTCPLCGEATCLGERYPSAAKHRSEGSSYSILLFLGGIGSVALAVGLGGFLWVQAERRREQAAFQAAELALKVKAEAEAKAAAEEEAKAAAKAKEAAKAEAEAKAEAKAAARALAVARVTSAMQAETNNMVELRAHGFMEVVTIDYNGVAAKSLETTQFKRLAWTNLTDPEVLAILQTATAYKLITSAKLLTSKAAFGSELAIKLDDVWGQGASLAEKIKRRFAYISALRDYNSGIIGTQSLGQMADQVASNAERIGGQAAGVAAESAEAAAAAEAAIRYRVTVNAFTGIEISRRANRGDVQRADRAAEEANRAAEEANQIITTAQNTAAAAAAQRDAAQARLVAAKANLQRMGFEVGDSGVKIGSITTLLIPSFDATGAVDRMIADLREDPAQEAERQAVALKRDKYLEAVASRVQLAAKLETDKLEKIKETNERNARAFFAGTVAAMQRTGFSDEQITKLVSKGGSVAGWGSYGAGEVAFPAAARRVVAVATGAKHTIGLRFDGKVFSLDYSGFGPPPVPPSLANIVTISAGSDYTLALRQDGTVASWDTNGRIRSNIPDGLSGVTAVAAGAYFSVALRSDGSVVAWGNNDDGQTKVPHGLKDVTAIAAGAGHAVALQKDGTIVAWGRNHENQTDIPVNLGSVAAIAAGGHHAVAIRKDGTVIAWGSNSEGQLKVPEGLTDVVAIAAGSLHTIALRRDGTVVSWGGNKHGQSTVPPGLRNVAAISAGEFHSAVIQLD